MYLVLPSVWATYTWMISMCMIYSRNDSNNNYNNKDVDTHSKYHLTRGLQEHHWSSPRHKCQQIIIKKFSIRFNQKPWSYGSFNGIRVPWNLHHKRAAKNLHITMITAFPHNPKIEATIISSRPHSFCFTLCSRVWKPTTTIPDEGSFFVNRVSGEILVLFWLEAFHKTWLKK